MTIRTDADGSAEGSFRVPTARRGVHTVRAVAPGVVAATARFRVTPRLRISPAGAGVGVPLRVSLTGYAPGGRSKVQWMRSDGAYATVPVTLRDGTRASVPRVDGRGSGSCNVAVPSYALPGAAAPRAIATTTDSRAPVAFSVAGCTLSPTTGQAGSTVTATCAGYAPGETVDLFWDRTGTTPRASSVVTPSGSGTSAIKLPAAVGGAHDIVGRSRSSGRTGANRVIVRPYLRVTPVSGMAGASVDAKLYGLRAGETVCVRWQVAGSATTTISCSLVADASGSTARFDIPIPADASTGDHRCTASDLRRCRRGARRLCRLLCGVLPLRPLPLRVHLHERRLRLLPGVHLRRRRLRVRLD